MGIPRLIRNVVFRAPTMVAILGLLHGMMIACEPALMFVAWMTWRASGAVVLAANPDDALVTGP